MKHPVVVSVYLSETDRRFQQGRVKRATINTGPALERFVYSYRTCYLAFEKRSGLSINGLLDARTYLAYQSERWNLQGTQVYVEEFREYGSLMWVIRRTEDKAFLANPVPFKERWDTISQGYAAKRFPRKKRAEELVALLDMVLVSKPCNE